MKLPPDERSRVIDVTFVLGCIALLGIVRCVGRWGVFYGLLIWAGVVLIGGYVLLSTAFAITDWKRRRVWRKYGRHSRHK